MSLANALSSLLGTAFVCACLGNASGCSRKYCGTQTATEGARQETKAEDESENPLFRTGWASRHGQFQFAWPIPGRVSVTDEVHKKGNHVKMRYALAFERLFCSTMILVDPGGVHSRGNWRRRGKEGIAKGR